MSNVFGAGSSYSPMHTASPMNGNPLTPGAGLMSPAYTPNTPMSHFDEGRFFWCIFNTRCFLYC